MPTALVLERDITAKKTEANDTQGLLLLIPAAICLFSIALAVEFPAFANVLALGLE